MPIKIFKNISLAAFIVPLILFIFPIFSSSKAYAQADLGAFEISSFHSDLTLNEDGSLDVKETLNVTFFEFRHGIFRDIPLSVELIDDSGNRLDKRVNFELKDVKMNHQSVPYEEYTNHDSNFRYQNPFFGLFYDYKVIKIGDPAQTVNGPNIFEISYRVKNVLVNTKNKDEGILYWGVTGSQWGVPINKAGATINLSTDLLNKGATFTQQICSAGEVSTTSSDKCSINRAEGSNSLNSFSKDLLEPGQAFNISVTLPKKYLNVNESEYATSTSDYTNTLFSNFFILAFLGFPALVALLMVLYWLMNRPPKGTGVIVPLYDAPDGLRPAEVGFIYDQSVDNIDYSATIIDLAIRGYLKISEDDKDYKFTKLSKSTNDLRDYERRMYNALFSSGDIVALKSLKNTYYKALSDANSDLQTWVTSQKYFKSRSLISTIGASLFVFVIIYVIVYSAASSALHLSSGYLTFAYFVIAAVSSVIGVIILKTANRKTKKGVLMREKILGLKQYIELADKNRINMLNAPEMTTELFEKLLPYAMVFRQHKAWAEKFQGIYTTPPTWYDGNWSTFNTLYLVSSLDHASSSMNSVLSSSPSSSGSGFSSGGFGGGSGGGFGGGGGGSW